jgi:hypothetical protein
MYKSKYYRIHCLKDKEKGQVKKLKETKQA